MEILKTILIIIFVPISLALIILTLMQSKDDAGASGTITGSSTNNFFEKNKGRTREGKLKRWTIISGVAFVLVTIALSIIYIA